MRRRVKTGWALLIAAVSGVLVIGQLPALAAGTPQATVVSAVPASNTPNIVDGTDSTGTSNRVFDLAQAGNLIIVAGVFTQVQNAAANGGNTLNRSNVFAFDMNTGAVSTTFAPSVNGPVDAVAVDGNTVFLGGKFSTVNGTNVRNLVALNLADGSRSTTFTTPLINGEVNDVAISGGRVFLGGVFTTVGGATHGGLASLTESSGAVDPYMSLDTAGHHNWYPGSTGAEAPVGVSKIDISPDGTQMVAIGNFKTLESQPRDQIAKILLQSGSAVVDPNWQTTRYSPACTSNAFDSYIRGVQWSPDGSYFVVTATGGPHTGTLCDTAARWNLSDTGQTVQPYWVAVTGGDTLWTQAVTGTAVYVGGHQRWLNNYWGHDNATEGAVPRPGIAALDPLSGVPLKWNPGRNPRGIGAQALLATSDGLYVGMDTDYFGNHKYLRRKVGFFPLAGGTAPAPQNAPTLPGNMFLAGHSSGSVNSVTTWSYDGTTAGPASTLADSSGTTWSKARGGFMIGNTLFYGYPDANGTYELTSRSFDGSTFGAPTSISTPYKDPVWDGVATGSGNTYDGVFPNFYGAELSGVQGMFYSNGRLYYTTTAGTYLTNAQTAMNSSPPKAATSTSLLYRNFSTDSGIVAPDVYAVPNTATTFAQAGGMFLSGGYLYVVNRTNGNLTRVQWTANGPTGAFSAPISGPGVDGHDWRGMSVFIGPNGNNPPPAVNNPPTASFTYSCTANNCSFDGSASSDPDAGQTLTYAWDFGDGTTGTGKTATHTYPAATASFPVTLTVNDGHGGTNSQTQTVSVTAPVSGTGVSVVGSAGTTSAKVVPSETIRLPAGIQAGDGMVLVVSTYSNATTTVSGFTAEATQTAMSGTTTTAMTTQVLQKVATGSEGGTDLTVPFSANAKATVQLVVYHGTPSTGPVRTFKGASETTSGATSHTTPTVTGVVAGDWVMSIWSDKSSNAITWTPPATVAVRDNQAGGTTGGEIATLVADSGAAVGAGSYGGLKATTSAGTTKATELTVVIAGS